MSLSDCEKCWDTPCTCGWEYRYWETEEIYQQIMMLRMVLQDQMINAIIYGRVKKDLMESWLSDEA